MKRASLALLLAIVLAITLPATLPVQADDCFALGFKTLHDLIPNEVGSCAGPLSYEPGTGDGIQYTTKGLLVWRKADNWTAFTNGSRTWINGPYGLQERSNSEAFDWELGATQSSTVTEEATCNEASDIADYLDFALEQYETFGKAASLARSASELTLDTWPGFDDAYQTITRAYSTAETKLTEVAKAFSIYRCVPDRYSRFHNLSQKSSQGYLTSVRVQRQAIKAHDKQLFRQGVAQMNEAYDLLKAASRALELAGNN